MQIAVVSTRCAIRAVIALAWIFSAPVMAAEVSVAGSSVAATGATKTKPGSLNYPATSVQQAPAPSARTISITGAGATYTGADLPCDFCTGRTNTVGTHTTPATNNSTGGPVTGDASMFGKHNLTPTGANTGEICAFCHTPQGNENTVSAPRWNRTNTTLSSYRAYSSLGSATVEATGSVSMSCLSCHDGSQAPNIVINTPDLRLNVGNVNVDIGSDLRSHHPVGIQYAGGGQDQFAPDIPLYADAAVRRLQDMNSFATGTKFNSIYLNFGMAYKPPKFNSRAGDALNDVLTFSNEGDFNSTKGEFNRSTHSGTGSGTVWWVRTPGSKKGRQKTDLYLFTRTDTIDSIPDESILNRPYVECATCHDPHSTNSTFLRMPGGNANSQICLTCHNK